MISHLNMTALPGHCFPKRYEFCLQQWLYVLNVSCISDPGSVGDGKSPVLLETNCQGNNTGVLIALWRRGNGSFYIYIVKHEIPTRL
jgi:hypothetical protein